MESHHLATFLQSVIALALHAHSLYVDDAKALNRNRYIYLVVCRMFYACRHLKDCCRGGMLQETLCSGIVAKSAQRLRMLSYHVEFQCCS